ncbi:uncharacterized protein [Pleurodeles waltl]
MLKRCYRSMFKETTAEKLAPVVKKPRPVESPSWKDMPTSSPHSVNRFVLGYLPQGTAYEQLLKQQHPEQAIPFSNVRELFTAPLAMQSVRRLSSDNSNHISEDQRLTLSRRVVETSVIQSPMEPSRHQASDDPLDYQELPLNLSSKRRVSEPSGGQEVHPDPSPASPCTTPRFLNHVSTLYPPYHIPKIEGPLKDQILAPKPCASQRASEVKNTARSASAPQCMYLSTSSSQINLKKDCLEDAKSEKYLSLDLTSGRTCVMSPPERLAGYYSTSWDNGHNRLAIPLPHASAMQIIPATQPSPTSMAQPMAAKPESHCKASQVFARPTYQKTEPQQQAQPHLSAREEAYVFSHSLMKQKYSYNAGTGSPLVAASTKPEIKPALYGAAQQDHRSTPTISPIIRIEMSESRASFPGSYQLNSQNVPTPTGGYRKPGLSPVGLINAGSHFGQCSLPAHATSPTTACESRPFDDMLQRRSKIKTWREQRLANGQPSLDVKLPRVGRQEGLCYDNIMSTQVVGYVPGALQKYLPLESHLKQVSGACSGGQRQTISSQHQGRALWYPASLQRDTLGVTGQKGSPQVQTFSPPVVS